MQRPWNLFGKCEVSLLTGESEMKMGPDNPIILGVTRRKMGQKVHKWPLQGYGSPTDSTPVPFYGKFTFIWTSPK